jgi:hypothetical protein
MVTVPLALRRSGVPVFLGDIHFQRCNWASATFAALACGSLSNRHWLDVWTQDCFDESKYNKYNGQSPYK